MSAPSDLLRMRSRRGSAPVEPSPLTGTEGANEVLGSAAFLALAAGQPATPAAPGNGPATADAGADAIKINPTKRTLRFIVPVTDGATYLGDVTLAVAPDDALSVQADRLLQMLEPILKPEVFARLKAAAGAKAEISASELAAEQITLTYDGEKLALAIGIPINDRPERIDEPAKPGNDWARDPAAGEIQRLRQLPLGDGSSRAWRGPRHPRPSLGDRWSLPSCRRGRGRGRLHLAPQG